MYKRFVKRALDIVLSVLAVIALSPLMAGIAAWIKRDSPGPVFFRKNMNASPLTFRPGNSGL